MAPINLFVLSLLFGSSLANDDDLPCIPEASRTLSNGVEMPMVAFGTAGLPRGAGHKRIVREAFDAGFRSFDTARATEWYDEAAVAAALNEALNETATPRDALFVTTKVHPRDLGYAATTAAVEASLATFQWDALDLVLLHYARCFPGVCSDDEMRRSEGAGGWRESWRALSDLLKAGKVRAIGMSNVDLRTELSWFGTAAWRMAGLPMPHVLQNWLDPFRQDREVLKWCAAQGVAYTSYSTLGGQWAHQTVEGGGPMPNPVFASPVLRDVAAAHGGGGGGGGEEEEGAGAAGPAGVALAWALARGVLVLPRSSNPSHIRANARALLPTAPGGAAAPGGSSATFSAAALVLRPEELAAIDALDGAVDTHAECAKWAAEGECGKNPGYMHVGCRASCGSDAGGDTEAERRSPPLACRYASPGTAATTGGGGGGGGRRRAGRRGQEPIKLQGQKKKSGGKQEEEEGEDEL